LRGREWSKDRECGGTSGKSEAEKKKRPREGALRSRKPERKKTKWSTANRIERWGGPAATGTLGDEGRHP